MNINVLTREIIGCAIEVHRNLGPGLLESAYEECLVYELEKKMFSVKRQQPTPVVYKEKSLNAVTELISLWRILLSLN